MREVTEKQHPPDWLEIKPWRWRNCREVGIKFGIWFAPWALLLSTDSDEGSFVVHLLVGPLEAEVCFNVGEGYKWGRE